MLVAAPARADQQDPRALFAAGRYAAAAALFERQWQATGKATDGVNAVVAWRTAGRYARARALLAQVRAGTAPPTADLVDRVAALEERLADLTATVSLAGAVAADAVVKVDGDRAERIGAEVIVDVGPHDLTVEQEHCERFAWSRLAEPGAHYAVDVQPRCDTTGTLHLGLEDGGVVRLDGAEQRVARGELDLKLAPGRHRLEVASRARAVMVRDVEVRRHETTSLRVPYPWRAQGGWRGGSWVFVATMGTSVAAGAPGVSDGGGFGLGRWGARYRIFAEGGFGMRVGDPDQLKRDFVIFGHPWIALTMAVHLWTRPLWQGRVGDWQLALDFDPLAVRVDQLRSASLLGLFAFNEKVITGTRLLPLTLGADTGRWGTHLELTLWPVGITAYDAPDLAIGPFAFTTTWTFGASLVFLMGVRF